MAEEKAPLVTRIANYIEAQWPVSLQEIFVTFNKEKHTDILDALQWLAKSEIVEVWVDPKNHTQSIIGPKLKMPSQFD